MKAATWFLILFTFKPNLKDHYTGEKLHINRQVNICYETLMSPHLYLIASTSNTGSAFPAGVSPLLLCPRVWDSRLGLEALPILRKCQQISVLSPLQRVKLLELEVQRHAYALA